MRKCRSYGTCGVVRSFPTVETIGYDVNRPDGTTNPLNVPPQRVAI